MSGLQVSSIARASWDANGQVPTSTNRAQVVPSALVGKG